MEIISGKIIGADKDGLTIHCPYQNWERYCKREYEAVQVGMPDGRTISPEQRRKAYALMGEIAAWSGYEPEEIKLTMKHQYMQQHMEALKKELFSLSDCDMTTAREFISYLIEFILAFDVPTSVPLLSLCDDIRHYVYTCLMHKKCAICGQKADLHHVDRVGMGRDRRQMNHLGMLALPLCREHHEMTHHAGDEAVMDTFHLEPVAIDKAIAKVYRLKTGE